MDVVEKLTLLAQLCDEQVPSGILEIVEHLDDWGMSLLILLFSLIYIFEHACEI